MTSFNKCLNDSTMNEIYTIFLQLGVQKTELYNWLICILIDRKKTEAIISDLFLCVGIKNGLNKKHLKKLASILLPHQLRARRLVDRMDYLNDYVVTPTTNKLNLFNNTESITKYYNY